MTGSADRSRSPEPAAVRIPIGGGAVSGLLLRPRDAHALLVLAHGAGAGMRHAFMEAAAAALAARGIATLRYAFPYTEAGRKRPDRQEVLVAAVRAAVLAAGGCDTGLPLFAGGKSMGGRMTSLAASAEPLPGARGLVFLGFPLHRPGDVSDARAEHLYGLELPMLFLQGSRDRLAEIDRVRRLCDRLGPRATLHVEADADHGFDVPRRSGRAPDQVLDSLAVTVSDWTGRAAAS